VSGFRLDRYEVSVGRFRKFLAVYSPDMTPAGAGRNPNNPDDQGWDVAWSKDLYKDARTVRAAVTCESPYNTWTASPGTNENLPMNCINWFEAFAFCVWDGGRLPTEAEWNYAASGGNEQRVYPWSNPPNSTVIGCPYANYLGAMRSSLYECTPSGANAVGSESPDGDGRWGQADLAGNIWEWALDFYANPYPQVPCSNCADMTPGTPTYRVLRGGGFFNYAQFLASSARNYSAPSDHLSGSGVRCARAPL
jgi:formylglycine-generating enzyme required for sulfatase activity